MLEIADHARIRPLRQGGCDVGHIEGRGGACREVEGRDDWASQLPNAPPRRRDKTSLAPHKRLRAPGASRMVVNVETRTRALLRRAEQRLRWLGGGVCRGPSDRPYRERACASGGQRKRMNENKQYHAASCKKKGNCEC
eukprot:6211840-Pleurochrysis_carterae.AAC.2